MDEYIKREAALHEIERREVLMVGDKRISVDAMKSFIKNRPSADVVPVVHGRWQGTADGYADGELVYDMWECSVCGFDADGAEEKPCWDFCPNCGAKMDLEALQ